MSKVTISLDMLKIVSKAMPKRDPRAVLIGVFVEVTTDGKTILTATDGKVLCSMSEVRPDNEGLEAEFILPADAVKDMLKRIPRHGLAIALVDTEENRIKVMDGKPDMLVELVDGKYPNYRAVVPDYNKGNKKLTSVTLRAEVLENVAQIAKANAPNNGNITLFFETKSGQIECKPIVLAGYKEQLGLIMPVKVDDDAKRDLEIGIWPGRMTAEEKAEKERIEAADAEQEKRDKLFESYYAAANSGRSDEAAELYSKIYPYARNNPHLDATAVCATA